jgi:hypothetical protein
MKNTAYTEKKRLTLKFAYSIEVNFDGRKREVYVLTDVNRDSFPKVLHFATLSNGFLKIVFQRTNACSFLNNEIKLNLE